MECQEDKYPVQQKIIEQILYEAHHIAPQEKSQWISDYLFLEKLPNMSNRCKINSSAKSFRVQQNQSMWRQLDFQTALSLALLHPVCFVLFQPLSGCQSVLRAALRRLFSFHKYFSFSSRVSLKLEFCENFSRISLFPKIMPVVL